jgi:hypothetical protein
MESGFSLIDIIVTLAISGTVFGTAIISIQRIGERHTLAQVTQRVRLTLEEAYITTLKTQIPTVLTIFPHHITLATPSGLNRRIVRFPISVLLAPHTVGQTTVTLYPSFAASPRQIDITHGRSSSAVIISLRGRVRVVWG